MVDNNQKIEEQENKEINYEEAFDKLKAFIIKSKKEEQEKNNKEA